MKVAVIHDWLIDFGGAEKVLKSIMSVYPDADVYCVVCAMSDDQLKSLGINKRVKTTFIQGLPWSLKKYRSYLPLMPFAIQQLDLSSYDLVISSSYCVAKGVITGPYQCHISYCHSPVRYAWDLQNQYLIESGMDKGIRSILARWFLDGIRDFDYRSSVSVDKYIVNSNFIGKRVRKFYGRDSEVIFPPVDTDDFSLCSEKDEYYLTCSRLVPYKKVGLIVDSFSKMRDKTLIVIGDGPDYKDIKSRASENIKMLGYVEYNKLISYMQRARAFVYAAEEDFGIVPVEAQACGTPVIGYGKGGLLDTVVDGETGIYFNEQSESSIKSAIDKFEMMTLKSSEEISMHAKSFSSKRFEQEFYDSVNEFYTSWAEG